MSGEPIMEQKLCQTSSINTILYYFNAITNKKTFLRCKVTIFAKKFLPLWEVFFE